jgi:protein-disulfide isomerase
MESRTSTDSPKSSITIGILFLTIGLLAGILIGLYLPSILTQQTSDKGNTGSERIPVSTDDDPIIGSPDAPVTIIEFSDFQCPFCAAFFSETLPTIKTDYIDTEKVRMVYRDFPLSNIHPHAEEAAEAANCASEQGKFWEYHDLLFQNQQIWASGNTTVELRGYASNLGLDETAFDQCLSSGRYADEVSKDLMDGQTAGVTGTPTFFINGLKVVGAQPSDVFTSIIDSELKR